jgi:hypothetical protein
MHHPPLNKRCRTNVAGQGDAVSSFLGEWRRHFSEIEAPPKHKRFQEIVLEAIIGGDLCAFKKRQVGSSKINRRPLPYGKLPYKRKYNPFERYPLFRGPTTTDSYQRLSRQ